MFHHLHVHSDYSVLDGFGLIEEYAKFASENGMGYLAATDHGMAAAWPSLMDACLKHGIRPVYGSELYVNDYHHLVSDYSNSTDEMKMNIRRNNHLVVLSKTEVGMNNISSLVTTGWNGGYYHSPRVSKEQIKENSKDIVGLSACLAGPICRKIIDKCKIMGITFKDDQKDKDFFLSDDEILTIINQFKKSKTFMQDIIDESTWWADTFNGDFFLEWQMLNIDKQKVVNGIIHHLSELTGIKSVLTNDVHYLIESDAEIQNVQLLLNSKGTISNPKGLQFSSTENWFTLQEDMDFRWKNNHSLFLNNDIDFYMASMENTHLVSKMCGYVFPDKTPKLPIIDNADEILKNMCYDGLRKRNLMSNTIYLERIEEELSLIRVKDFSSYFLIQREIIQYVKTDLKKPVGPGRGSVGGCLIAFLLGITQIDPVKHGLLFSRFLSPSRGGKQMKLTL